MPDTLSSDNLTRLPHVAHAFFTRAHGNGGFSGQETPQDVYAVRAAMAQELGVAAANLLCCHQVHSADVVTVTEAWPAMENPHADAMVTDKPGFALGILTADCTPVLFAASDAPVIGAAHAGWRGAVGGILDNTLTAMEALGAKRNRVIAALGPCIWQASYEVGPEFPAPFLAEDDHNSRFFTPAARKGHFMFDLPGYVMARLLRLGVGSVALSPADTCAAPERFFSHRYSTLQGVPRGGNLMSAICLK